MKTNVVRDKSFQFALKAIRLYKHLQGRHEYILSRQFLKSATSIGANVEEALAGVSKRDFIAKMAISSKEARETLYWLRLIEASKLSTVGLEDMIHESRSLINLLTAIVKTAQQNLHAA